MLARSRSYFFIGCGVSMSLWMSLKSKGLRLVTGCIIAYLRELLIIVTSSWLSFSYSLAFWSEMRWLQRRSARNPIQVQQLLQLRSMQSLQSEWISQRALDERNSTTEPRSGSNQPSSNICSSWNISHRRAKRITWVLIDTKATPVQKRIHLTPSINSLLYIDFSCHLCMS